MAIRRILLSLVWSLMLASGSTKAVDFQKVVGQHFPGYRILSPEEINFEKVDKTAAELKAIQPDATSFVANFNSDGIPDFAAIIRDERKVGIPTFPGFARYSGGVVACTSISANRYQCQWLVKLDKVLMVPHGNYLWKIAKGERLTCMYERQNPYAKKENMGGFRLRTDAIGYLRLMGNGDSYYVPLPNGKFFQCTASD